MDLNRRCRFKTWCSWSVDLYYVFLQTLLLFLLFCRCSYLWFKFKLKKWYWCSGVVVGGHALDRITNFLHQLMCLVLLTVVQCCFRINFFELNGSHSDNKQHFYRRACSLDGSRLWWGLLCWDWCGPWSQISKRSRQSCLFQRD